MLSYDFTDNVAKAYTNGSGDAMIQVGTKWCFFSGDLDHDGALTGLDYIGIDNDINNFADYNPLNDVDGDGAITGLDYIPIDNGINNFQPSTQAPPGAPLPTPKTKLVRHQVNQVKLQGKTVK